MQNNKTIFVLIGFLIGFIMGSGISFLGLLFFNWSIQFFGKEPVAFTIWSLLPWGILLGLSMAINVSHPPFGD